MSLHDRIMSMCAPDNVVSHPLCMGGYSVAQQRAAQIAKEADELIDWLQSDLETLGKLADSASSFGIAQRAIDRIEIWKEQTK